MGGCARERADTCADERDWMAARREFGDRDGAAIAGDGSGGPRLVFG
jgi:predicted NUDIX family NTP pyrophosphohydrolase